MCVSWIYGSVAERVNPPSRRSGPARLIVFAVLLVATRPSPSMVDCVLEIGFSNLFPTPVKVRLLLVIRMADSPDARVCEKMSVLSAG
jgi:hypothetical protein